MILPGKTSPSPPPNSPEPLRQNPQNPVEGRCPVGRAMTLPRVSRRPVGHAKVTKHSN